ECCSADREECDDVDFPVCDSEGHTHANICKFERAACLSRKHLKKNLTIRYQNECCIDDCNSELQIKYTPLCDNIGQSHKNWCKFRVAQCEYERINSGRKLYLAYKDECCKISRDSYCNLSGPICDSDGKTHLDLCEFHYKQCLLERTGYKTITIDYYGTNLKSYRLIMKNLYSTEQYYFFST
ncbi:unnamed protein product, partial [Thelazia callipaeda]|uniref:Kazal-like domain-containing protein n=1 Tax=Thelazia callipaeda TaxID=103827 RepID=A0A0N5DAE3_THECL